MVFQRGEVLFKSGILTAQIRYLVPVEECFSSFGLAFFKDKDHQMNSPIIMLKVTMNMIFLSIFLKACFLYTLSSSTLKEDRI